MAPGNKLHHHPPGGKRFLFTGIKEASMRSLASPFRVKWFAALAGGGVSQTEEKVVFKEAHDRALVSSWGAALGPLCYGTTSVVE